MQTLFRIVEITSGQIEIDGVDISTLGLRDLREKLAIIPQDALLFNGTIRSNLDPFGEHNDATLWDALRRAYLVDQASLSTDAKETAVESGTPSTPASRFTLDLPIDDEGLNLSVGERSLVSLARAVVRNAQILVLDEATASVDLSTDAKVQKTIREAFTDKTLLIIAHRLRTIIDCQRVLVMSDGQVAEFDSEWLKRFLTPRAPLTDSYICSQLPSTFSDARMVFSPPCALDLTFLRTTSSSLLEGFKGAARERVFSPTVTTL